MGFISSVQQRPELRDRTAVFHNRTHAGMVLVEMLGPYQNSRAIVRGIPAGGLPVAYTVAKQLQLQIDLAVVSKITLPWNSEAGYGAIAFDGTLILNQRLVERLNLTPRQVNEGIEATRRKVASRVCKLRGERPFPSLEKRTAILVDVGLALGFTMLAGIRALRNRGAREIVVAVPTAHDDALGLTRAEANAVYCPNLRSGWTFAVADAYHQWSDVSDADLEQILFEMRNQEKWQSMTLPGSSPQFGHGVGIGRS